MKKKFVMNAVRCGVEWSASSESICRRWPLFKNFVDVQRQILKMKLKKIVKNEFKSLKRKISFRNCFHLNEIEGDLTTKQSNLAPEVLPSGGRPINRRV